MKSKYRKTLIACYLDLIKFMIGSGVLCLVCYLLAALGPFPILNLAGCIACGFSVGIM